MKKIIKKISLFTVLLVVLFIISGCGNSNSIVGTWEYFDGNNTRSDVYYQFNKDNSGSYSYYGSSKTFKYEDRGNKVVITYDGNTSSSEFEYSINDGTLTIKDSFGSDVTYKRK